MTLNIRAGEGYIKWAGPVNRADLRHEIFLSSTRDNFELPKDKFTISINWKLNLEAAVRYQKKLVNLANRDSLSHAPCRSYSENWQLKCIFHL